MTQIKLSLPALALWLFSAWGHIKNKHKGDAKGLKELQRFRAVVLKMCKRDITPQLENKTKFPKNLPWPSTLPSPARCLCTADSQLGPILSHPSVAQALPPAGPPTTPFLQSTKQ